MTYLLMIIGTLAVILGIGMMSDDKPKSWKSKNKDRRLSPWDKDPFYGTPLQKF